MKKFVAFLLKLSKFAKSIYTNGKFLSKFTKKEDSINNMNIFRQVESIGLTIEELEEIKESSTALIKSLDNTHNRIKAEFNLGRTIYIDNEEAMSNLRKNFRKTKKNLIEKYGKRYDISLSILQKTDNFLKTIGYK